jgi:hypothetical protein
VALGHVNFGITETGITGVHSLMPTFKTTQRQNAQF